MSARVQRLILAQLVLGDLVACKGKDPSIDAGVVPEPPATVATVVTTAPPSTSTSAPAMSTGPKATPTIALTVSAKPVLAPGRCYSSSDCPGGNPCSGGAPGEPGYCIRGGVVRGRPLLVEGAARTAAIDETTGEDDLERAAREEHASVAAFARTACELIARGAPLDLLRDTQAALADEIRHTEMMLDAIERRTGARPKLLALPEALAPLERDDAELFRDVFWGGVIGETLAAADADRSGEREIAEDEARHAALAVRTLRWLSSARPSLARVRDEELARWEARAAQRDRALLAPILSALA